MSAQDDPFAGAGPLEVPLKSAPLVRVIAQVRFPLVVALEQRDFVAPFQEAVREPYPVLRQEQAQNLVVGPTGMTQAAQTIWRFTDVEGHWRLSLAPDFLALETTAYSSRKNFLERFRTVIDALNKYVNPRVLDRLGVRYIDRISGSKLQQIRSLVRPEVRGIAGSAAGTYATHSISESLFSLDKAQFIARWGRLPAGATVDPAAIEPIGEPSWILDLDMFRSGADTFNSAEVMKDAERFAERIYAFFRWAVTDEFLAAYGGVL